MGSIFEMRGCQAFDGVIETVFDDKVVGYAALMKLYAISMAI